MFRIWITISLLGMLILAPHTVHAAGSASGSQQPSEFLQAKNLLNQHKYEEAIPLLETAVAKQPKNPDILNELGYAYREVGRVTDAQVYYYKALAIKPDHVGALNYLGMLYVENNQMDQARETLQKIDDACFFTCDEYTSLKKAIETGVVPD